MPKKMELSFLIDIYAPLLTEKQREVVELYYYEDLSLAEIAAISKISRQGVRDSIKRAEDIILNTEEKLHFGEYITNVNTQVGTVLKTVDSIENINTLRFLPDEVKTNIDSIKRRLTKLLP